MHPILQSENSECGLACLGMILAHFGNPTTLGALRRKISVSQTGVTLHQLMRHATLLKLSSRAVRLELEELPMLVMPSILHWDLNHFVVLVKIVRSITGEVSVIINDPAVGRRKLTLSQCSKHFTGVALELNPNVDFVVQSAPKRVAVTELIGKITGFRTALIKLILLAMALELFVVISPLFNQFVIDEVIISGDRELLKVLVFAFAIMIAAQNSISLARSWLLMRWSVDIGLQWSTRVFAHLLKLPMHFFEKRQLGDIVSRFGSLSTIQSTMTNLVVESLLDGIMAILALGMMLAYSIKLSVIVLIAVILYIFIRAISYSSLQQASRERLILSSKENSYFIETIRAIMPLKLFGTESARLSNWLNLRHDVINRDIKTQKLGIVFKICNTFITSVQTLILFYVGAESVMSHSLTIGMLIAFSSYSTTFTGRVFGLIDLFINVKMLNVHTERLADIVKELPESDEEYIPEVKENVPEITLKNISFRYSDGDPWILRDLNFSIPAGQSVAITGPSGCGKSTLCKLILGLIQPTEGEILIDGISITKLGLRHYRSLVGTVTQDDVLLAGSISDNISFFDNESDFTWIEMCAKTACIDDEIRRMPMGYQTLVGEMGSSLSGGQRQRLFLARALYKRPKILALDESTSHLDVYNENLVNTALKKFSFTRIMIAHRPETIRSADRVVELNNCKLTEVNA